MTCIPTPSKTDGGINNNNNNKEILIKDIGQALLEAALNAVRGETIKYNSYKKERLNNIKTIGNRTLTILMM